MKKVIKLASNENLWGPSVRVRESIITEIENICFYPQPHPSILIDKIAFNNEISSDSVIVGNGTDELISLISSVFLDPEDNIVVSENSFIRYKMSAVFMGSLVKEV
ncbi:aminotransferase class I/II-fold pyridoxal phosphate-dependent enzyme, partial [Elusimicrobiota bacterium]